MVLHRGRWYGVLSRESGEESGEASGAFGNYKYYATVAGQRIGEWQFPCM